LFSSKFHHESSPFFFCLVLDKTDFLFEMIGNRRRAEGIFSEPVKLAGTGESFEKVFALGAKYRFRIRVLDFYDGQTSRFDRDLGSSHCHFPHLPFTGFYCPPPVFDVMISTIPVVTTLAFVLSPLSILPELTAKNP
jgi:hypothetical protein